MTLTHRVRRATKPALFLFILLAASSLRAAEPITVCAYNLKNWLLMQSYDRKSEEPRPKPEEEKAKIIEFLSEIQPDILGVCEIGTQEDLLEVQSRMKDAGMDLPHFEFSKAADPTRSLGLLSRFPISARDSQRSLSYQIKDKNFQFQRGILDVTVDIRPDFPVRFLGVHLKSKREIEEANQAEMRREEARLLRRHLDKIFDRQGKPNIVLYGDFNEHSNEPAIREILGNSTQQSYMLEIRVKDSDNLLWTHFWAAADVYSRLDYFFVSRNLRPRIKLENSYIFRHPEYYTASDHRPLVLSLEVPTP